jgi:hypothetical protein
MLSEWTDDAAFHHFIREIGVNWIDRGAPYRSAPPEYTFFEPLKRETTCSNHIVESARQDSAALRMTADVGR